MPPGELNGAAGASARRVRLTGRLRLEAIRRDHADDLWRLHQDDGVAAWYAGVWSHEDAVAFASSCEEAWGAQGVSKWMAYERVDGSRVGRGGLSRSTVDGGLRVEVGWTVRERLWGRGFATEIGRAGLVFAFDELRTDEVVAFTEATNVRSRAVRERLAMGHPREITFNGTPFVLYTVKRTAE